VCILYTRYVTYVAKPWRLNHVLPFWSFNVALFLHGAQPFSRGRQLHSYPRSSENSMEPEGSLPGSQELSTGSYPESDQSSLYYPILSFPNISLKISIYLRLGLPSGPFPPGFLTNIIYSLRFDPIRSICPAHLVLLDFFNLLSFHFSLQCSQYPVLKSSQSKFLP
jgi:hypothetical protein